MFILKTGHQPGVYVPLRALFLVPFVILNNAMAFVYAYIQCFDGPVNWFSPTFCVLICLLLLTVALRGEGGI